MSDIVEVKKRGRKIKYETDEERIEARRQASMKFNANREKKGHTRKYASFEEAQEANRKRALERYYRIKNSKLEENKNTI